MISKEMLGKRLRDVRQRNKLTLKDVEGLSGLSSTHISEIERGMTSPTIGALIRIAHAMRKDASFFIEERELDEVCVTTEDARPADGPPSQENATRGRIEHLTRGVLGGRICVHEVVLEPGGTADLPWITGGEDVGFYCVEGKMHLIAGRQEMLLLPGDSVHGALQEPVRLQAGEDLGGRVVIMADPRADSR